MSILPPCLSVLKLHCKRAKYLAGIWKQSKTSDILVPCPTIHGWNQDKLIVWVKYIFPKRIQPIIIQEDYNPEDNSGNCVDSDDEE